MYLFDVRNMPYKAMYTGDSKNISITLLVQSGGLKNSEKRG